MLNLGEGENRFNPDSVGALVARVDEAQAVAGSPAALVVRGGGKYFSNGLDLRWMLEDL